MYWTEISRWIDLAHVRVNNIHFWGRKSPPKLKVADIGHLCLKVADIGDLWQNELMKVMRDCEKVVGTLILQQVDSMYNVMHNENFI